MGKKYSSREEFWEDEIERLNKLDEAFDVMEEADALLWEVYEICNEDKYDTPVGFAYQGMRKEIQELRDMNENMQEYARKIHDDVAEVEHDFYVSINEIMERVSVIDINEKEVKNTIGSTNTVTRMSIYERDKYETVKEKKSHITYKDIMSDSDILGIEERYKEYKKSIDDEEPLTKEEYITALSTTNFAHEAYSEWHIKLLSDILDVVPFVGGVKGIIEAAVGETLTGEMLTEEQKKQLAVLSVLSIGLDAIPYASLGKSGFKKIGTMYIIDTAIAVGVMGTTDLVTQLGVPPELSFLIGLGSTIVAGKITSNLQGADSFDDWLKNMSPEDAVRYNEWHNLRDAGHMMPWEDYLTIRNASIHNSNGKNMTLGKYFPNGNGGTTLDSYLSKAQSTGDMYFDLGKSWDEIKVQYNLTDNQMFDIFNKPALDNAVNAGKGIRFSQDPRAYGECALKDEWTYLKEMYGFKKLEQIGDYWYARY